MELIIVIALLGILSAMVVPSYAGSISRIQFNNAKSDVVSVIRYVQERAISDALEYRVYFDAGENGYWVGYGVYDEFGEKHFTAMTEDLGQWQRFPDYIQIDNIKADRDNATGFKYLACYPTGACSEFELHLRDGRSIDREFKLKTMGIVGKLEVKSNEFNF